MSAEDDHSDHLRSSDKQTKPIIGTRVDAAELFRLLESHDSHFADEVKALIYDNLNSSKESWLLNAIVEYYMGTQSSRCIEILTGIREPHDKHLFDKLIDFLKSDMRPEALVLLGHIVRCQPSWLHRIASHRLMHSLLHVLKTDVEASNLMSALLIVVTLLPMIPSLFGPYLQDIFEVFSRIAAWKIKKPGNVPDVHLLHLHVPLYWLFLCLYALYPCNFLAYLRSFYGSRDHSRENLYVFTETIKPMLERVRLHPLLVTASKETELISTRWKNMETHDVIVQCAKVWLDPIEGTHENASCSSAWQETSATTHPIRSSAIRQSALYGENNAIPIEPGSIMHETLQQLSSSSSAGVCPLFISDLSPTSVFQDMDQDDNDEEEVTNLLTTATSHAAKTTSRSTSETREIEATSDRKEENVTELHQSRQENNTNVSSRASSEEQSIPTSNAQVADIVQAEEAKEDSAGARKKVSTSAVPPESSRCDGTKTSTNFVSTTDNLTAAVSSLSTSGVVQSGGETAAEHEDDLNSSMMDDGKTTNVLIQRLVHGMTRLRFFSHCVHPPDIPVEWIRRTPVLKKASSCPDLLNAWLEENSEEDTETKQRSQTATSKENTASLPSNKEPSAEPSSAPVQESCEFPLAIPVVFPVASSPQPMPLPNSSQNATPLAAHAMTSSGSSSTGNEVKTFSSLSPPEILDRHMQLGSEIYLKELNAVPLTSTKDIDWSHFGGTPPAEELIILRGQISLLHNQLLFERYRRGVHAERNRRLLGNAKRACALEEQNLAMKDQLLLQEKEINEMTKKLHELNQKLQHEQTAKPEQDLHDHLRLLMQDNKQLDVDKKEMQYLINSQRRDIDRMRKQLDETQASLLETNLELDAASKQADKCMQLEEHVKQKTKQLTVLYELHGRYKDKMENLPKPRDLEYEYSLLADTAKNEIEELHQIVKHQNLQVDYLKGKVDNLEKNMASKDLIIAELKQLVERIKALNGEELESRDSRLLAHRRIIVRQEEHIMELSHKICMLSGENSAKEIPAFPGCRDFSDLLTPLQLPILSEPLGNFCHVEDPPNGEDANAANSSSFDTENNSAPWEGDSLRSGSSEIPPAEGFAD